MARLAEAVAKLPKSRSGPPCLMHTLLNGGLPKVDAQDLKMLLADESITTTHIQKGLESIGKGGNRNGTIQAIRRHRRSECGCTVTA